MNPPHPNTLFTDDVVRCVDQLIADYGKKIVLGMPLALGKSYQFANELYRRAKLDPEIQLLIATALSLEKPTGTSELERRIMEPMVERIWKGVPDFEYMLDLRKNQLPPNVILKEFYFKAGAYNGTPTAQQNHYSSNYTHVVRDMVNELMEQKTDWTLVFCQTVAKKEIDGTTYYSDSCNADLTLDLIKFIPRLRAQGMNGLHIAQVNNCLPFMYGDAVHTADFFDVIIENEAYHTPLFSAPKEPVSDADYLIGLHVSPLIKDGGTLQVGIGSLGDAISNGLLLRNDDPETYNRVLSALDISGRYDSLIDRIGGTGRFEKGLYGSTEMLVGVFVDLYKGGVLKRKVYDDPVLQKAINQGVLESEITPAAAAAILEDPELQPVIKEAQFSSLQAFGFFKAGLRYEDYAIWDGSRAYSADLRQAADRQALVDNCVGDRLQNGIVVHGSFFIGPNRFYQDLRQMGEEERKQFMMTGVSYVNQLYGNQTLKARQRKDARFVNAGLKISVLGNIASDGLENGTVISGVGGQYNFVSMGHALDDARVIMMIRSTKEGPRGVESNIVFNYGYTTIPRHLKDIVVTEYGIADLRGKTDQDVAKQLINIADSRFQEELLEKTKQAGKIAADYQIPAAYTNNYPATLSKKLAPFKQQGYFKPFPLGTELTDEEIGLAKSLRQFKAKAAQNKISALSGVARQAFKTPPPAAAPYLERMQLATPASWKEKMLQKVVLSALSETGLI